MRRRWTWVAWSMMAVYIAGLACTAGLAVLNGSAAGDSTYTVYLPAFTAFMVVGALVVARRPANPIGWLFSTIGLLALGAHLAHEYFQYASVTRPDAQPFPIGAIWYLAWAAFPVFGLTFTFTLLLFPTGRLPSPRWRPIAWLAGAQITATSVLGALQPTLPLDNEGRRTIPNPIGISWLPAPDRGPVGAVLFGLFAVASLVGCASLVLRFRRARGVERQQLKWVAYAAALMVISNVVGSLLLPDNDLGAAFTIALLPVAAGIAILRYRLYDIDRLINRTLVYGLLTASLGLGYTGTVLVLGQVFGGVGRDPPSWVVAGTTLAVAALFQPARRRIQAVVDRRFNRRKYDAHRTVEAFTARLRDEVDLDALLAELLTVVDQTMQPTRTSLWLRQSAKPR